MPAELGRIKKVSVRSQWEHEEREFTPWLAQEENIAALGKALGVELEVENIEVAVGPYSADILAKDSGTDRYVVIENQFGNIPWEHTDRVHRVITEEIPARVAADTAYKNTQKNSDKQNARIEHDKALERVMTAVLKDDTELFKQFSDNQSFKKWLSDTIFGITYEDDAA